MNKIIIVAIFLSFVSCHQPVNEKLSNGTLVNKTKHLSVKPSDKSTIVQKQLIGIWRSENSMNGNASYAINDSVFYDPETEGHYKYKIIGDKIKIDFEDGPNTLDFKFKGNDVLVTKDSYGTIVYHRVKK